MPRLHKNYYRGDETEKIPYKDQVLYSGYGVIDAHPLFSLLEGDIYLSPGKTSGKNAAAVVDHKGNIFVNVNCSLNPDEWAYVLAHCLLHLAFGHFDKDKIPRDAAGFIIQFDNIVTPRTFGPGVKLTWL